METIGNAKSARPVGGAIAGRLAALDAAMRRPGLSESAAVRARVRFFVEAIRSGVQSDTQLNTLGDVAAANGVETLLSERSYNLVFEDGQISDKVVVALVRKADRDKAFEAALVDAGYRNPLVHWRAFAGARGRA